MKRSPRSSSSNLRVFSACLLSFLMFMTPLATLAASIKPVLSPDSRPRTRQAENQAQISPAATGPVNNRAGGGFFSNFMPVPPVITATKVDAITDSVAEGGNNDGNLDPGEKITYTVTINNAVDDATGVTFNDTVHPHTTYVPNSLNASPLANSDSYETIANTLLEVGPVASPSSSVKLTVTGSVLDNDTDFLGDGAPTVVAPFPTSSANGGIVSMDSAGHFSFTPKEGSILSDTFTYTISDDGADNTPGGGDDLTSTATVTITIKTPRIWYVQNDAAAGGLGRSTDPFDTLLEAQTAATNVGDIVYVFNGDGTNVDQNAGFTFQANNQQLIGEGVQLQVTATVNGVVNPVLRSAGTAPNIGNSGGNGVTLTNRSGIVITGFDITGSTNAVAATFSVAGGGVTISNNPTILGGATGNAIDITTTTTTLGGATVTITNNTITGAGQEGIDINGQGSGGIILNMQSNAVTSTGNGIDINGTSGGTLNISAFANNSVSGASGANGIIINTARFDSDSVTGGFQPITAGTTAIGSTGNGVGGSGLVLINTTGNLPFVDLDIFADNGSGLDVTGAGSANSGITVGANVGVIEAINGPAVKVSSATIDLQLTSIKSTNSGTTGIELSSTVGPFSAGSSSSIANTTGNDIDVNGGSGNFTYSANISNTSARSISVSNRTGNFTNINGVISSGGTIAFSGTVNDTGTGISLTNNTGTIINFTNTLTLTTGANAAFTATGGGTVTSTATASSITTTTGTALNVANTNIGASGLTFTSISANGATNGILLNTTGTAGGLTVTGTGTTLGSGGTIQNTTGDGVSLNNSHKLTLKNMDITNAASAATNAAICHFENAAGCSSAIDLLGGSSDITLDRIRIDHNDGGQAGITGVNVNKLTVTNTTILEVGNADAESAVIMQNAQGVVKFEDVTIDDPAEYGIRFYQTSATLDLTLRRVTVQNNLAKTFGEQGFSIRATGTSNSKVLVDDCDFLSTDGVGVDGQAIDSAILHMTVQGSDFTENRALPMAVNFTTDNTSQGFVKINDNDITDCAVAANCSIAIDIDANRTSTLHAIVTNNRVPNGAGIGTGLEFVVGDGATGRAEVRDNTFAMPTDEIGMTFFARQEGFGGTNGSLDVTFGGNNITGISSSGLFIPGVQFLAGGSTVTAPNHDQDLCVNTKTGSPHNAGGNTINGTNTPVLTPRFEVSQRTGTVFKLQGFTGTGTNATDVGSYFDSNNTSNLDPTFVRTGGTNPAVVQYTSGTCNLPTTPTLPLTAFYMPETNQQRDELAQADISFQNSNNSLLAFLNISPEFASTLINIIQSAKPASAKITSANAKPAQASARGNFLDAPLAFMMRGSQATSPAVKQATSESIEVRDESVALAHASSRTDKGGLSAGKRRSATQPSRDGKKTKAHSSASTFMPSGESLTPVSIGTLKAGQSVTIQFQVTLDTPPNLDAADLVGGPHVRNQGTVSGSNFSSVLTDDPAFGGASDPTDTPVDLYDSQTSVISSNNNSSQGESITFTATVINNQTPPPTVPGGTVPTGTVQFFDGVTPITCDEGGTSTQTINGSGQATCTTSGLTPGAGKTIKAQYNGDGNFDTSFGTVSQTVTACLLNPVVTSTADSGAGTLRDAVANICNAPNNNVTFNLGAGPHTITLLSTLVIAKNVNITNTLSGTNGPVTISAGGGNFGVIRVDSPATAVNISNLTVTGATATSISGGGLLVQSGTTTLTGMLFTGNTVINGDGGGVTAGSSSTVNIRNSTISGNTARHGGGLFSSGGAFNLLNVTVTNNNANGNTGTGACPAGGSVNGAGGGIETGGNPTNIKNSIITGNTACDAGALNTSGAFTNQGNNLLSGDPRVAALASNGGPTQTHALLPGSPALDAGDNTASDAIPLTTDQRGTGYGRNRDAASDADTTQTVDIGAFEADPSVEDIGDKTTTEDTAVPQFSFGVGDAASAFDSITAVATTNPSLVATITVGPGANSSLRTLDITPAANQSGTATITVTVTKTINSTAISMSDTFVLTVSDLNDAPTAGNDALSAVAEDSGQRTITIASLLANDSPPASESGQTIALTGVGNAVGGTVSNDATNVYFTPNADFNGPASFEYTITDNGTTNGSPDPKTATATVSFTVTEVNDTPVPANDTLAGVGEDSGQTIIPFSAVTANDSRGAANESGQTLVVSSISNTGGGTFILDSPNSRVLFTPASDFTGTASFDYQVTDNGTTNGVNDFKTSVGSATASIPVGDTNDAPTAVGETISSIAEDSGQRIIPYADILGNDIKGPASESAQTLVVKTVSSPVGGTVTNDLANSRVLFTPTADFNGAASFQYTIEDNGTTNGSPDPKTSANTVTTSFTITEVNDTPVVVNDSLSSVVEDSGQRIILFTDLTTNDNRGAANESGQTLTVTTVTNAVGGTATLDTPNSRVLFTPTANFSGTASFDYTVQDNGTTNGGSDPKTSAAGTASFEVTPVADTPTVTNATTAINTQTTSGLVIDRNAADGAEVTHFKITGITNGTLYQNDGTTQINNGDFITYAEGNAGLRFTPDLNKSTTGGDSFSFQVQSATDNAGGGLSSGFATATITVSCTSPQTVTSTLDDGSAGTLRYAVENSCQGGTITFNLGAGANTITLGSELFINKNLTITGSDATSPVTISGGGVTRVFSIAAGFTVNISNLTIADGQADIGGGIYNLGNLTISNSTFTNNHAVGSIGDGGAIDSDGGMLIIVNSTISGNSAQSFGGGLHHCGDSTAVLTNVTITNNRADSDGDTFGAGGGISHVSSNSITLNNTIVAGNFVGASPGTTADDVDGTIDPASTNNLVGVDPRLAALASNGGPTQTHALLAGSAALDAGSNTASDAASLTTDQRGTGFPRKRDAATDADTTQTVDIGAFEADPSVEDISDKATAEDTALPTFTFRVGDSASAFTSITGTSSNTTLVPNANITVGADTASTRTLSITPAANQSGTATITVTVTKTINSTAVSMSDTFVLAVGTVPDTPSVTNATTNEDTQTTSGLVISRNAGDETEVTHFKITNITGGALFKNDGVTPINNNDFLTFAEGNAGLKFTPAANSFAGGSFQAQSSTDAVGTSLSAGAATATITVNATADTPSVTNAATSEDTQTSSGLVISRNASDGAEVTHFKITGISGGSLFKNNGTTPINNNDFITFAEGNAGLRFTPAANSFASGQFQVQAATSAAGAGLSSGSATATITVSTVADAPTVTPATTNEDTQTTSGLVITKSAVDGAEVTHFKITGITGGTLFQNNGTTQINNNDFITVAQGGAGLKFTPAANSFASGQFQVQGATDNTGSGLGTAATATITVNAVADTPSVTNATTNEDTQTSSGLVISRNASDGTEVTHFKITGITGGTLFKNNGTTQINNGDFITFTEGNAGLRFTPAENLFSPTTTFSFQVQAATSAAGAGLSAASATATITVNTVADTPGVTNATTLEEQQTTSGLVISRNPADGAEVTHFKITAITNGTLFQSNGTTQINNNDFITVAQGNAGLKFTPAANFSGSGQFQVQSSLNNTDAGLGGNLATGTITVTPINDAPTLNALGNLNINEDAPQQTVNLAGISAGGGETQTLVITATSDNTGLVPNPTVNYTSPNATGSLTFTPVANQSGSALITVTVNDGGGTANGGVETVVQTFTVTVNAVNDVPSFTKGPDVTSFDPTPQTHTNWATNISAGPADESGQTLTFLVSNDNNGLFAVQPAISPSGTLTFQANDGADGVATVTVQLKDNGGTANGGVDTSAAQTFTLTVHALNNAPTLNAIGDLTINEDAPLQTVNLAGIGQGAPFESGQTLTVTATSSNTALIPHPTVSYTSPNTTGSISFTPVTNANGSVVITVTVTDNGGTLGGGVDTFSRTFIVTVNPINDAPINSVPGNQNGVVGGTLTFNTANGNLISIADDSGSNPVQVTLKATDGTLTLSTTFGLTFTVGDGTHDPLMTFTGSLANINEALNGMTNLVLGSGVIEITTNDQGHTGAGGALTDTDAVQVTVIDNLAPVLLTVDGSDRAIAFDSPTFVIDPFSLHADNNFTADHRTRIVLFALHVQLRPSEDASAVTAEADVSGTVIPLTVEVVRTVPGFDWLTQLVVRLPANFSTGGGGPHDARIRIRLRGQISNYAVITVVPAPPGL